MNELLLLQQPAISALLNTEVEKAKRLGVHLRIQIYNDLKEILCSVYDMNKILGNVIQNAIEEVDVHVRQDIEEKGRKAVLNLQNDEVVLSSDSMKSMERIFLPFGFYRAHQSFLVLLLHGMAIYPDEITRSYAIELTNGIKIPLSLHKF